MRPGGGGLALGALEGAGTELGRDKICATRKKEKELPSGCSPLGLRGRRDDLHRKDVAETDFLDLEEPREKRKGIFKEDLERPPKAEHDGIIKS